MRKSNLILFIIALGILIFVTAYPAYAGNIESGSYAWGQDIGWLNWGTTEGDITVSTTELTGYIWGENIGWISLNCSNTSSCDSVSYKVENTIGGILSGYAWGENVGWINFNPTYGGVTINTANGQFEGYAWGENVGWISLNCSNTSSCDSVEYYVLTSWRPERNSGGGSGGSSSTSDTTKKESEDDILPKESPSPTASPVMSPSVPPEISPTISPFATPTETPVKTPMPSATPTSSPQIIIPPKPPTDIPSTDIPDINPSIPTPAKKVLNIIGSAAKKTVSAVIEATKKSSKPISIATAPLVVVSSAVNAVSLFFSGVGFLEYLRYILGVIAILLGIKKKTIPWGRVFNSKTLQPMPFTAVQLLNKDKRVIDTKITDQYGRYGFIINPESFGTDHPEFMLNVSKKGFVFPPTHMYPQQTYRNVYSGGIIRFNKEKTVNYDIAISPLEDKAQEKKIVGASLMGLHNIFAMAANAAFWISIIFVPLNYIYNRTTINLIMLLVLLAVSVFRILGDLRAKPYGLVINKSKGGPMPYALINLNDDSGKRIGFAVSNESGKYVLLTNKGELNISLFTPATIRPPRTLKEKIKTKSGWITKRFRL